MTDTKVIPDHLTDEALQDMLGNGFVSVKRRAKMFLKIPGERRVEAALMATRELSMVPGSIYPDCLRSAVDDILNEK